MSIASIFQVSPTDDGIFCFSNLNEECLILVLFTSRKLTQLSTGVKSDHLTIFIGWEEGDAEATAGGGGGGRCLTCVISASD